jgi:hypothetical protein
LEFGIQFRRETGLCLCLFVLVCLSLALKRLKGRSRCSPKVCGLFVLLLLPLAV